jgi:DNA-binding beta-propeller fold protein YncE
MKLAIRTLIVRQVLPFLIIVFAVICAQAAQAQVPVFQVDPSWPGIPGKWVFGLVSGLAVDEQQNHVWVIHRPHTVKPEQKGKAGPAVFEFDSAGNFIQAWGGPGVGYEWPGTEHGVYVDNKDYVWIAGSGKQDHQILKFTRTGKFVMQIGHSGKSSGNTDTKNVNGPADVLVYPKTNEVFVADGYGNHRVIVFDADTGAFKRMWGAFGNPPTDDPPAPPTEEGSGSPRFGNTHSARVSNDGLVYVCDRGSSRFQVFTVDGRYVTQVFLSRDKASREKSARQTLENRATEMAFGRPLKVLYEELEKGAEGGQTASRVAFSPDPEQRFLYVIDRPKQQVAIFDRKTLTLVGSFGRAGQAPGEFFVLHDLAVDKQGDIYTAEVNDDGGRRAQKFTFKGLSSASGK